jgi:cellulose synthase/poly-beta-1,6-N-acetylglucosamine synthase-like glycosyltransferase
MTLVSINVCVRNGADWIDDCIESLINQTHKSLEIILVDDGSTDGSKQKVENWNNHEMVTTITQEAIGLSAGRMAALEASKGEWVAITDIDVRPEPNWIEQMLNASESQDEDEDVVAVTGRTIFGQSGDVVSLIRSLEIELKYRSRPRSTSLANGPCSMFRREKLISIGGFDPSWYHAEDMEVSLKLIESGGTIVYAPDAVVKHIPETGLMRFLSKRKRDARAHVRIVRKYSLRKRKGPGFDFLGSSWIVLLYAPTIISMFVGILLFATIYSQEGIEAVKQSVTSFEYPIWLFIPIIIWCPLVLRSNLSTALRKRPVGAIFTIMTWSFALWQGIIMGYCDALFKRNGH